MKKPKPEMTPTVLKRGPSHEEIAAPAHLLWHQKGCPHGRDEEIWLEAERGILAGSVRQVPVTETLTASDQDIEDANKIEDRLDELVDPAGSRSATSL
jgi:Protein of unknown function (DUF2934)